MFSTSHIMNFCVSSRSLGYLQPPVFCSRGWEQAHFFLNVPTLTLEFSGNTKLCHWLTVKLIIARRQLLNTEKRNSSYSRQVWDQNHCYKYIFWLTKKLCELIVPLAPQLAVFTMWQCYMLPCPHLTGMLTTFSYCNLPSDMLTNLVSIHFTWRSQFLWIQDQLFLQV